MKKKLQSNLLAFNSICLSMASRMRELDIDDTIIFEELDILVSLIGDTRRIINGDSEA